MGVAQAQFAAFAALEKKGVGASVHACRRWCGPVPEGQRHKLRFSLVLRPRLFTACGGNVVQHLLTGAKVCDRIHLEGPQSEVIHVVQHLHDTTPGRGCQVYTKWAGRVGVPAHCYAVCAGSMGKKWPASYYYSIKTRTCPPATAAGGASNYCGGGRVNSPLLNLLARLWYAWHMPRW